jgi:hypothetical protein
MADWDDVRRIALGMPGAEETVSRDAAMWRVGGTGFVWERPLRRADLAALGIAEQEGPVLGAKVDDEAVKHALVAEDPDVFFTTPHFDGYASVLIRLDRISERRLGEVVAEAWHTAAPAKLRREWLNDHPD